MKNKLLAVLMSSAFILSAQASTEAGLMVDELVPNASNIEEVLLENDLFNADSRAIVNEAKSFGVEDCYRDTCAV